MFFRLVQRVPWQVSGALGWGGLASAATLAEVSERESPAQAASYQLGSPVSLSPASLEELRAHGYLVIDGALDEAALVQARAECASLQAAGSFLATDQHEETLRSDAVHWLSEARSPSSAATAGPGLLAVLRRLRALALQLETTPGGVASTQRAPPWCRSLPQLTTLASRGRPGTSRCLGSHGSRLSGSANTWLHILATSHPRARAGPYGYLRLPTNTYGAPTGRLHAVVRPCKVPCHGVDLAPISRDVRHPGWLGFDERPREVDLGAPLGDKQPTRGDN